MKDKIKKMLKQYGAYYHMIVQNGMGAPGLDFVGCHAGRFFGIEAKAGKKEATDRQLTTMKSMMSAGGQTFLVNEVEGWLPLESWLKRGKENDNGVG